MKNFPYLAIDLETTGLDPTEDLILQIGAIYDDGVSPVSELKRFSVNVTYKRYHGTAYALAMNAEILSQPGLERKEAIAAFNAFIASLPEGKITLAGKNVGAFDLQFLKNETVYLDDNEDHDERFLEYDTKRFAHRILDVGSLYAMDFDSIPPLEQIMAHLGLGAQEHSALADCEAVVHAIRVKRGQV